MYSLTKRALAECLGTFVLVFFACGTAIVTNANVVATAIAFGLCIVAMAYSVGNISGCHVNPAVSLGMLIAKRMNLKEFGIYVLAQFVGAILGALLLFALIKGSGFDAKIWATNAVVGDGAAGIFSSLGIEIVLTFVFVYTILGVTADDKYSKIAGIVIGLTLTLVHLIGINLTGTSVNPARSFGPAIMDLIFNKNKDAITEYWVFLIAPLMGGALAAVVYKYLHKKDAETTIATQDK